MQFRSFALLAATTCVISAQAQEAPRFSFISPSWLRENTAQGKRVFAEAQALQSRLTNELRTKVEELQRLEQQLRSSSLSEDGRARLNREFEDGRIAIERMREDSQGQYERVMQAAMQQFEGEIMPIIDAVAKEQKLQYVLQTDTGIIAWADTSIAMSFTEEVGKRYDAAYPGTAARTNAPNPGNSGTGSTRPAAR